MSSPAGRETFIDLVLAGRARYTDIDDHIDAWHDAPEGSPAAELELHEYLGMSWDEYRLWGERPESLRFVVRARRVERPLDEVLAQTGTFGAAARSTEQAEAAKVLQWLAVRGRIGNFRG